MSIRVKLLVFFGFIAAFGFAAFVVLWLYGLPGAGIEGMNSHEYQRAIIAVEALADKERDSFEFWFEEHRRALRQLSTGEAFSQAVGAVARDKRAATSLRAQLQRQLSAVKEASPGVYNYLYVVDAAGMHVLVAADANGSAVPDAHRAMLAEVATPGMTEFVRVFMEDTGPGLVIASQIGAMDEQGVPTGRLNGILVAGLAMGAPLQHDEAPMRQTLGMSGAVMLVDSAAKVLFSTSTVQATLVHGFVAAQAVSGTEGVKLLPKPEGGEAIAVFRHIHLGASDELSLAVTRDTDDALAAIRASFVRMSGLLALLFLASMGLIIVAANRIARTEAALLALNAELEHRIDERTQELEQANGSLRETLSHLELTQDELVRTEKLAALGSLVAGIAHELNTPIGNSLTVASTLQDHVQAFSADMERGLTRSRLAEFVASTREGAEILMRCLERAVELVTSFKQVAVDQTSSNRRKFNLRETVNEILLTLGPSLRKTTHQVRCEIAPDIEMEGYPGPLGQVLTNLINNALLHAFEGRRDGKVTISAKTLDDASVEISVADDGVGIAEANLTRVFDPFFTTKLGQGGSGLGLNIVYNLVTKSLGGTVRLYSQPGHGSRVQLRLPRIALDPLDQGPIAQAPP